MRTSIILDDALAERLRAAAKEKGQSLSGFLADAGRVALGSNTDLKSPPFELLTYGDGGLKPGVNLDRSSELLAAEDAAQYGTNEVSDA